MKVILNAGFIRRVVVNLPSGRNKYPGTTAVLQELINERNTWRIMGKVNCVPEFFFRFRIPILYKYHESKSRVGLKTKFYLYLLKADIPFSS